MKIKEENGLMKMKYEKGQELLWKEIQPKEGHNQHKLNTDIE